MALAGRSCRTRDDRETIAFGGSLARAEATVVADGDDAPVPRLGQPRRGPAPPRRRRARRTRGRPLRPRARPCSCPTGWRWSRARPRAARDPPRRVLRRAVAGARRGAPPLRRALAQRNALLGRIRAGGASAATLDAWDRELAGAGVELAAIRAEAVERLAPALRRRRRGARPRARREVALPAAQRGRARPRRSRPSSPSAATPTSPAATPAGARTTTRSRSSSAARSLRRYGSQGQQRAALLALLFAERERCSTTAARCR